MASYYSTAQPAQQDPASQYYAGYYNSFYGGAPGAYPGYPAPAGAPPLPSGPPPPAPADAEAPPGTASTTSGPAPPPPPPGEPTPAAAHAGSERSDTTTAPAAAPAATQQQDAASYDAAWQQYYAQYYAQHGYYPPAGGAAPTTAAAPPSYSYPYANTAAYPQQQQQQPMQVAAPSPYAPRPPQSAPPAATGSYNAVPPPSHLHKPQPPHAASNAGMRIRPQYNVRPAAPAATARPPITAPPAYTRIAAPPPTVAAQKPAAAGASHASSSASAQASGGGKFPPAFTSWVERCFERCRTDADRVAMTQTLTGHIKAVEAAGRMWLVDWEKEPPPQLPSSGVPSHTSASPLPSPTGTGASGLRSKRSRWEEASAAAAATAQQQQLSQQQQQQTYEQFQQQKKAKKGKAGKSQSTNQWVLPFEAQQLASQEEQRRLARAGRFGDGRAQGGVQAVGRSGGGARRPRLALPDDGYEDDVDMDHSDGEDYGGGAAWSVPAYHGGGVAAGGRAARDRVALAVAVQGTSQQLEKSYFRLTGPPDPSSVRPPVVLRKALERLVSLLRRGAVNWFYACDQFKGMRQDCTVQHLRDALAVEVYEAHARSALEYGDLAEFNQCQTQLAGLYADGVPGCVAEFTAYRLLYNTAHASSGAQKAVTSTLRAALALQQQLATSRAAAAAIATALPSPTAAGPKLAGAAGGAEAAAATVANALAARAAAAVLDLPAFFAAYALAPALGRALLDVLAPQLRWAGLNLLVRAYKTSLPMPFVAAALGFSLPRKAADEVRRREQERGARQRAAAALEEEEGLPGCRRAVYAGKATATWNVAEACEACGRWLQAHGATIDTTTDPEGLPMLDVKASQGKLFVPEEPKVSHGDENLSLEDFLSRASGLKA